MPKENGVHNLIFPADFFQLLNALRENSSASNQEQVSVDVARKSDIYIKSNEDRTSSILWAEIKDPERRKEVFFDGIASFDPLFRRFVNTHFHQGGQLYTGIRFLDINVLGSLGFKPADATREFIFEEKEDQLIVEEVFRIKSLKFLPLDDCSRPSDPSSSKEEYVYLSDSEKVRLRFLRSQLEAAFAKGDSPECSLSEHEDGNSIYIDDINTPFFLKENASAGFALLEFRVKHRMKRDDASEKGVSLSALGEEDIRMKVHKKLLNTDVRNNGASFLQQNQDFSKLLSSPELTVDRYQAFTNCNFYRHTNDSVISAYHQFVVLILTILLNYYINQPFAGLSSEQTERLKEKTALESDFSQRMRA